MPGRETQFGILICSKSVDTEKQTELYRGPISCLLTSLDVYGEAGCA